jgi:hypothetical protein
LLLDSAVGTAALSETRLPGESQLEEVGSGYTFFWIGKLETEDRQSGVGFAVRSALARAHNCIPVGVHDRLMTLRMKLTAEDRYVTFVSAYAPTMTYDDATKERFYEDLDRVILSVPAYDKLLLLGDFNARVGREVQHWSPAIGHHGVGKENSNGTLLLSTCMKHNLVITNTLYQQADKYKTTWMHPRSRHWHLIDYVITRLGDRADVNITRAMRGTGLWSDHRLLRAKVNLNLKPKLRRTGAVVRKCFNVQALKSAAIVANFRKRVSTELSQMPADDVDVERSWSAIKTALYVSAGTELRPPKRKHQDWFDDNDASVSGLLQSLHSSHATWLADRTSMAKKEEYLKCKRTAQASLRRMKDAWWSTKALELQAAADQHDSKKFYGELRAIYGPKCSGSCPILSADGSTKLVEANKILSRWAEHFNSVLNCRLQYPARHSVRSSSWISSPI